MIAYVDSSVVLRRILSQPNQLAEWKRIVTGVSSRLLEVECLRTLDRLRVESRLTPDESALASEAVFRTLDSLHVVELTPSILRRAGQARGTPLGTLDSLHLATAEAWREDQDKELTIATHDRALSLAARAAGFQVIG